MQQQKMFAGQEVWRGLEAMSAGHSLTAAAHRAGLEVSAASKALARLEDEFGAPLVDRGVRPMRLSPEALRLLPHIRALTAAQAAIEKESRRMRENKSGTRIRVSLSAGSFNAAKVKAFRDYEESHPGVRIEAVTDLGHEALERGEVDLAAVSYPVQRQGLTVFPLGTCANLPLASASYLARSGTPHAPEELSRHTLLFARRANVPMCVRLYRGDEVFSLVRMRRLSAEETTTAPDIASEEEAIAGGGAAACPRRVISGYYPTLLAALEGQGIAFDLALGMVSEYLERGLLVPVLQGWHRAPWKKSLLVKTRDLENPWIREFVDWYRVFEPASSKKAWRHWYKRFAIDAGCVRLD